MADSAVTGRIDIRGEERCMRRRRLPVVSPLHDERHGQVSAAVHATMEHNREVMQSGTHRFFDAPGVSEQPAQRGARRMSGRRGACSSGCGLLLYTGTTGSDWRVQCRTAVTRGWGLGHLPNPSGRSTGRPMIRGRYASADRGALSSAILRVGRHRVEQTHAADVAATTPD